MTVEASSRQSTLTKLGRASGRAARSGLRRLGYAVVAVVCAIFVFWDADWWQVRDRIEHIYAAFFTSYVSPECRKDPTDCVDGRKQKPIGPPAEHVCDRQPELAITCQMQTVYVDMNKRFFRGRLPGAVITLQRKRSAAGYYFYRRFQVGPDRQATDEIALNPQYFSHVDMKGLMSTLLHEMCHQYIAHFGVRPKGGFHSREWALCMLKRGLIPVSLDRPGQMTGFRVTDKVKKGGVYDRFAMAHPLIGKRKVPLIDRR